MANPGHMSGVLGKVEEVQRLVDAGRAAQASPIAQRLVQQHPASPDINALMSLVCFGQGLTDRAEFYARTAQRLAPDDAALMLALSQRLTAAGKHAEAVEWAGRACERAPADAGAWTQRAHACAAAGRPADALDAARRAAVLRPDDPELVMIAATALVNLTRIPEAVGELEHGVARFPAHTRLAGLAASTLNYDDRATAAHSLGAHRRWAQALAALPPLRVPADARVRAGSPGVLNVGILSSDLRRHSVAYFLEPFARHHDRARVRLVGFQLNPGADAVTKRLRGQFDGWVEAGAMDGLELATAIRREGLDVLVETNGLTEGQRLAVLSCRPAPVQLSYCGYPNTLTLPWIDGRIVDSWTDPVREEETTGGGGRAAHEPLLRLDPCFLCYEPPPDAPAPGVGPMAANGFVTFGSFNAVQKLSDATLGLWAKVLAAVPGSRLIIKALNLRDDATKAAVLSRAGERLSAAGVDPVRLELLGPIDAPGAHMAAYGRIDVALDTTPYNGTTTTCEAMWMGVPVVALAGATHHARVGVSLLNAVGLAELIGEDAEAFVRITAGLARDAGRLGALRGGLRERLRASPLCDGAGFAARMTAVLAGARRRA